MPPKTVVPTEWRPRLAGSAREHQRHDAQDEGERGHQDRPQPDARRLDRGVRDRQAALAKLLGELDDQDRVLAGESPTSITSPIWQ